MPSSTLKPCCHHSSEAVAPKAMITSLFSGPAGLLTGFCSKKSTEAESTVSPKSPFEFRSFSSFGNYFVRSPRSSGIAEGHRKRWDFNKVGLGLLESLNDEDEAEPCRRALGFSETKNILFGPQMRINSLPKDNGISSNTYIELLNFTAGDSKFNKIYSCSPNSDVLSSDSDQNPPLDPPLDPLPVTLSVTEIEQSEDYTCITTHGPNPKTTHIFGDCIVEGPMVVLSPDRKNEFRGEGRVSPGLVRCSADSRFAHVDDFSGSFLSCEKKLRGEDIYIHRGERAFCSYNCSDGEILIEDEMEKPANDSSDSPEVRLSSRKCSSRGRSPSLNPINQ